MTCLFVRRLLPTAVVAAFAFAVSPALASSITAGDLVVYRVGTGTGSLVNTGNAVFVDEYTTSGTLVQSIPMPTTASAGVNQLIASGTATSEGLLTVSADGQYVALMGYATNTGGATSLASTTSAAVPRTVGIITTSTGNVDTSTALTDFASANNPRSAVTTDGTSIWVGGASNGVSYATKGASTSTQLSTTVANVRQVNVFASQLYTSSNSGSIRLATVGANTPTTSGQTITNLPGFPTTGSPYGFFFADLSPIVAGLDTVYVADDGSGIGIQKYSLVGGTWTAEGTITAASVRGLTGLVVGNSVQLFGTTGGSGATGGGSIYAFTDSTGYASPVSGSASTIATAVANEAFRGIGIVATVPEPTSIVLAGVGLVGFGLALARRR